MTDEGVNDEFMDLIRSELGTPSESSTSDPVDVVETAPPVPQVENVRNAAGAAALEIADVLLGRAPRSTCRLRSDDGEQISVGSSPVVLGRNPDGCDLANPDGRVSRRHVEVVESAGGVTVRDLGSSNGTQVVRGDVRLDVGDEPVEVRVGDRIVTIDDVLLAEVVAIDDGGGT